MAAQVVMETNSSVVLVDTSGGFSASFLQEVMLGRGRREEVSGEEVITPLQMVLLLPAFITQELSELLERVQVYHSFSIFDLLALIEQIKKQIAEQVSKMWH